MLKIEIKVALVILIFSNCALANGRQPCDRGAGGISHCENGRFICNDGRVSGSKKVCLDEEYGSAPAGKKSKKKNRNGE